MISIHCLPNFRTFRIDQDVSSVTNNIDINLTGSSRNESLINLTFSVISSGTLSIPLMNTWLNETNAEIPSEEAIEEPPIGATDVRIRAERIELPDGQIVSEGRHSQLEAQRTLPLNGAACMAKQSSWTV